MAPEAQHQSGWRKWLHTFLHHCSVSNGNDPPTRQTIRNVVDSYRGHYVCYGYDEAWITGKPGRDYRYARLIESTTEVETDENAPNGQRFFITIKAVYNAAIHHANHQHNLMSLASYGKSVTLQTLCARLTRARNLYYLVFQHLVPRDLMPPNPFLRPAVEAL